jgi:signal transduction histidine kinase/ActR/RegA family two-component response regulator
MAQENVLARIADNPNLPSPPTLTLRILEQTNRPSCTITEIGKIISLDPALCVKMLRLVNSSLYGLHTSVTSIERALNLLGLNHVRSLVLSLSLPSLRFKHASDEQKKSYWKSSVTVAMVCRELAMRRKWVDPDSEMVAGLLCDLGILLLQGTFPVQYAKITANPPAGLDNRLCELEEQEIGVDHAVAGAHFLRRWKLAEDLTEAIRFHHRPAEAPPAFTNRAFLLHFASQIAQLHQTGDQSARLDQIVSLAQQRFGLYDEQLFQFLESLEDKVSKFAALIEVDVGPCESFSTLFAKATENLTKLAVEASLDNFRIHEEKNQVELGLKLAKETLQKTEEQLRQAQKMEAIGRLAGGVAHDFNNLLTVIIGNCELLLSLPSLDTPARAMVETVMQTGTRAANLTRQLLAFGRKQLLLPEVTYLNTIVSNMSDMLGRLIGDDIQMTVRLADDLERVKIDPTQIEQVIVNLAVNARDAMPNGGFLTIETFNLLVEEEVTANNPDIRPGQYVVLAMRDTGCGMNGNILRQVFEPFFTTKDLGKGTGLGLATVHGIVRQSGGHITVASAVGQGTVFHIYLPVANEPLAKAKPGAPAADSCGTETILLTEDKDDVRAFARRTLEAFGYSVLEARDGDEALKIHERTQKVIHLLVTDIIMSRMHGYELARFLTEKRPGLKVLYTAGYRDNSAQRAGLVTASIAYLQKPFTSKTLLAKVRETLRDKVC